MNIFCVKRLEQVKFCKFVFMRAIKQQGNKEATYRINSKASSFCNEVISFLVKRYFKRYSIIQLIIRSIFWKAKYNYSVYLYLIYILSKPSKACSILVILSVASKQLLGQAPFSPFKPRWPKIILDSVKINTLTLK